MTRKQFFAFVELAREEEWFSDEEKSESSSCWVH